MKKYLSPKATHFRTWRRPAIRKIAARGSANNALFPSSRRRSREGVIRNPLRWRGPEPQRPGRDRLWAGGFDARARRRHSRVGIVFNSSMPRHTGVAWPACSHSTRVWGPIFDRPFGSAWLVRSASDPIVWRVAKFPARSLFRGIEFPVRRRPIPCSGFRVTSTFVGDFQRVACE